MDPLGGIVFGATLLTLGVYKARALFADEQPVTPIASLVAGHPARVVGRVTHASKTLEAPLSRRRCAAWAVDVYTSEYGPTLREVSQRESVDLVVEDHSGRISIAGTRATLILRGDRVYRSSYERPLPPDIRRWVSARGVATQLVIGNADVRCVEGALAIGELVEVIGTPRWSGAETRRQLELAATLDTPLSIADTSPFDAIGSFARATLKSSRATPIAKCATGDRVKLVGTVVAAGDPLFAPATRRPCVAYELRVALGSAVYHDRASTMFELELDDGTRALVEGDGTTASWLTRAKEAEGKRGLPLELCAKMHAEGHTISALESGPFAYEEAIVEPGDRVAVVGVVHQEPYRGAAMGDYRSTAMRWVLRADERALVLGNEHLR